MDRYSTIQYSTTIDCEAVILAREFTPSKRRDQLARGKRAFVAADEEAIAEPLLAIA
jgi:hypothetical protein